MNTLIILVGLPRSGKTTWAKAQGHPIVNRDAIRLALHGQAFILEAEAMVTAVEELMVTALFRAGHDTVIVDATHITLERRLRWTKSSTCPNMDWNTKYEIFSTPPEVCTVRAVKDGREDLIPIIDKMYTKCDVPQIVGVGKILYTKEGDNA